MYKENAGKMKESWRIRFSTSQSMPYVEAYSGETVHTITTGNKFLSSIHMYLDYDSGILAVYSNVSNIVVNTRKSNLDNAVNRVYSFNTKFSEPLYPMFVIPKGADIRLN